MDIYVSMDKFNFSSGINVFGFYSNEMLTIRLTIRTKSNSLTWFVTWIWTRSQEGFLSDRLTSRQLLSS